MRNVLPRPYRRVVYIALAQHIPLIILCILLPLVQEHAMYRRTAVAIAQYIAIAVAAHWGGILCIMVRDPKNPAPADKLFVAMGFLPIAFIVFVVAMFRYATRYGGWEGYVSA